MPPRPFMLLAIAMSVAAVLAEPTTREVGKVLIRDDFRGKNKWMSFHRGKGTFIFERTAKGHQGPGVSGMNTEGCEKEGRKGYMALFRPVKLDNRHGNFGMKVWCRTSDITEGAGITLMAKWWDKTRKWVPLEPAKAGLVLGGTNDWQKMELEFGLPEAEEAERIAYLVPMMHVSGSIQGKVLFDGFELLQRVTVKLPRPLPLSDGRRLVAIVVPPDASQPLLKVAEFLNHHVELACAFPLKMETSQGLGESGKEVRLHCLPAKHPAAADLDLTSLSAQGFVIAQPDQGSIVLASPSEEGLRFAACEFLERYLGVRWLFPGAVGTHVPEISALALALPKEEIRQEPVYRTRLLSSRVLRGSEDGREWAANNRMLPNVRFHHSLFKLFPPGRYAKSHPHLYPIVDGKRVPLGQAHTRGLRRLGLRGRRETHRCLPLRRQAVRYGRLRGRLQGCRRGGLPGGRPPAHEGPRAHRGSQLSRAGPLV